MAIRLRMAMHGGTHKKIFHIVAIDSKLRREAKPTELLGIYDPHSGNGTNPRVVRWSVNRLMHWLGVGAVPSKPVAKLLQLVRSVFGSRRNCLGQCCSRGTY
jgi:small subunit ribosomal protein S16